LIRQRGWGKISKIGRRALIISVAVSCLMVGTVIGYFIPVSPWAAEDYIPSIYLKGDVLKKLEIGREILDQYGEKGKSDRNIKTLNMEKLVSIAIPASNDFDLYIIAEDGRTAMLSGKQLANFFIGFSSENSWEAVNPDYPVSTNIKDIDELVVVLNERQDDFGLNIINMEKNITYITPGRAYLSASRFFDYGGTSSKDLDGTSLETSTFKEKYIIGLKELTGMPEQGNMVLMGAEGQYQFVANSTETVFEIDGNTFKYSGSSPKDSILDLKGVVLDPSASSIMDVYYDAKGFIGSGNDVLLIITDGMGYHQYEYAMENGYAPFLASISRADTALSVYTPVTNSGLAAMLTGKPPCESGIYSRKQRIPEVPTIMGDLLKEGNASLLIEGDIQIIKTEVEASLHSDTDADGTIDDEILEAAMDSLYPQAAFMAVHFHSIDDAGHEYGDLAIGTMERIESIDSYIRELASAWRGKIIITSDHGMHSTDNGGDHGQFRYEDMVVPYIIIDGGLS